MFFNIAHEKSLKNMGRPGVRLFVILVYCMQWSMNVMLRGCFSPMDLAHPYQQTHGEDYSKGTVYNFLHCHLCLS